MNKQLELMGFHSSKADQSLFLKSNGSPILILVYVDKCLIVAEKETDAEMVVESLQKRFELRTEHCPTKVLGMRF